MQRTGRVYAGGALYVPADPVYDQIYTGPPSDYVDPAAVQAAPFNPNAAPLDPRQLPYVPAEPPDLTLGNQPLLRG